MQYAVTAIAIPPTLDFVNLGVVGTGRATRRSPPTFYLKQMNQLNSLHPAIAHVLQFFAYEHLPVHLQEISKPFGDLANKVAYDAPSSQETTVALRKLLEAKDAAVRAKLNA